MDPITDFDSRTTRAWETGAPNAGIADTRLSRKVSEEYAAMWLESRNGKHAEAMTELKDTDARRAALCDAIVHALRAPGAIGVLENTNTTNFLRDLFEVEASDHKN